MILFERGGEFLKETHIPFNPFVKQPQEEVFKRGFAPPLFSLLKVRDV